MYEKYAINREESQRIDIIKVVAIIFVLYIHSHSTVVHFSDNISDMSISTWLLCFQYAVSEVISRCGVPLFFLLSAILLFSKERRYQVVLKTKIRTIVIPYLFWNSFWILIWIILQQVPFTGPFFSGLNDKILDMNFAGWLKLYGVGWKYPSRPMAFPLWYLRDLFVMCLLSPIIRKMTVKFTRFSLVLGIALAVCPEFWFSTAFAWFLIGGSIVAWNIPISIFDNISCWKLFLVYAAGMIITVYTGFVYSITWTGKIFIFIGIVFWIRFSKVIFEMSGLKKMFLKMSGYVMFLFVFHEMTMSSVKKVLLRFLPNTDIFIFLEYVFLPFFIIAICILASEIMKKIMPRIYSISTGGR